VLRRPVELAVIRRHQDGLLPCPLYPQQRPQKRTSLTYGSELARAFYVAALVGAAMCSAFKCGTQGRLAITPSADQVPVKSTHSRMRWHMWIVLIAGSTGSALRAVRPPNLHITPDTRRDLVYVASATGVL
jgi:hypothetical protein